jgi:hypothetical protein
LVAEAGASRQDELFTLLSRRQLRQLVRNRARLRQHSSRPNSLLPHAERRWSQNLEDGIVEEIFARVGSGDRRFCEIGASDGSENCTRALAERGWEGLWVEADPGAAARARKIDLPQVRIVNARVDASSDYGMLRQLRKPDGSASARADPDLLVIDIDGDDLAVLRASLEAVRPRVLVVEYNAAFGPDSSKVFHPDGRAWDGTIRHGAALRPLAQLAASSGLSLVGCDPAGVNAFFVRDELLKDRFDRPGDVAYHYVSPAYPPLPGGHVRSRAAVAGMEPLSEDDCRRIALSRARAVLPTSGRCSPSDPIAVELTIGNGSGRRLTSGGDHAVKASLGLSGDPAAHCDDHRARLPFMLAAGRSRRLLLWLPAPATAGRWWFTVSLLQEGIAWMSDFAGNSSAAAVPFDVDG